LLIRTWSFSFSLTKLSANCNNKPSWIIIEELKYKMAKTIPNFYLIFWWTKAGFTV
jgi:hypothetical protein